MDGMSGDAWDFAQLQRAKHYDALVNALKSGSAADHQEAGRYLDAGVGLANVGRLFVANPWKMVDVEANTALMRRYLDAGSFKPNDFSGDGGLVKPTTLLGHALIARHSHAAALLIEYGALEGPDVARQLREVHEYELGPSIKVDDAWAALQRFVERGWSSTQVSAVLARFRAAAMSRVSNVAANSAAEGPGDPAASVRRRRLV